MSPAVNQNKLIIISLHLQSDIITKLRKAGGANYDRSNFA